MEPTTRSYSAKHWWHALAGLPLAACGADVESPGGAALPDVTLAGVGFRTPECAVHDTRDDVYLVSNISGDPLAADGDGFISRVAPDGSVLALRWIDGASPDVELDAPKGLAVLDDAIYVADLTRLRKFDRRSGAALKSVVVDGATFLNDVAVGPDGALYVTDSGLGAGFAATGTDAVYRFDAELSVTRVASGVELGQPNGIAAGRSDLFVATWGSGVFGSLMRSGSLAATVALPHGQLDGVVRTRSGTWLVSSWQGRAIYEVAPSGAAKVRFADLEAPADIGYDAARDRLLIPLFTSDTLLLRALSPR